jgi:flagellar biosynthesis protein FlhA
MSDISAGQPTPSFRLPSLAELGALIKRGDIALAVGVLTILVVLILPLPPLRSASRQSEAGQIL